MAGSLHQQTNVVVLSGYIDATGHGSLREALVPLLYPDETGQDVEVDVSAVRLLDAGAIRLLLQAWQVCADTGRRLRLVGAGAGVRQVLEAVGAAQRLLDSPGPPRGTPLGLAGLLTSVAAGQQLATTEHHRVAHEQELVLGRLQQRTIDGELRATRRLLLTDLRRKLRTDPRALLSQDFLTVADGPAILDGVMLAGAVLSGSDAADLQAYDPATGGLRMVRYRGLARDSLHHLAAAGPGRRTVSAVAAETGEPVLVDDLTRSPIFAGQPGLRRLLAAGLRAVHAYPLHDDAGQLLGVLSFHYRTAGPRHGDPELITVIGSRALAQVPREP